MSALGSQAFSMTVKHFFDKPKILRLMEKANLKALRKSGAVVRKIARRSIRSGGKGGKVSRPGEPPRSHTGILKRFLFFALQPATTSVFVGPIKTNQVFFGKNRKDKKEGTPLILEVRGHDVNVSLQDKEKMARLIFYRMS